MQQIIKDGDVFILNTKNTTYAFSVLQSGHLAHLYYGNRVDFQGEYSAILPKCEFPEGNLCTYGEDYPTVALENCNLEFSTRGKGDIREPMIDITYPNGSSTCDFVFENYNIHQKSPLENLPSAYDESGETKTLIIKLKDKNYNQELQLHYSVFYNTNVITRSAKLINNSEEEVKINRFLSCQLDFDQGPYVFSTFKGAWTREMNKTDVLCEQGIVVNDSKVGASSNRSNPFVMLSKPQTSENCGNCVGINLIYSGNHFEACEVNSYQNTHFICGINPFGFEYHLSKGESFQAPEAVLTFSENGYGGVSENMHEFVREHIVFGEWKNKERPILLNSWEAFYFDFSESKLLSLAKAGKKVGAELFVLDDGWFGERNDDKSSLGDWVVNKKKLPNGLSGLANKINKLGMQFGIWVEPEMVSYNSECYRNNPSFAVEIPNQTQSLGRNQLLLDLTQQTVQDYIINQMRNVFSSANISYVKWDMNRIVTDAYSVALPCEKQGEFFHRYILGLYRVLETLTKEFPNILFESCASGGNRCDLGMMQFMPQVWASDNTDAICRSEIQTGYSYAYPMSVIGAHVSSVPNHQTLRKTSLDTRFNVACFGLLGYECNLSDLPEKELSQITQQIAWYKKYRNTLQFGDYHRIKNGEDGVYQWICVSKDKKTAIGAYVQTQVKSNYITGTFKTKGLCEKTKYHFYNMPQVFDLRDFGDLVNTISPIHIKQNGVLHNISAKFVKMHSEKEDYFATGSVLNSVGVRLKQGFGGTGFNDNVRLFQDYASRLYVIEAVEEINQTPQAEENKSTQEQE
ncbi:MAG: alpha-galactosidase [Bacillota bacterium]